MGYWEKREAARLAVYDRNAAQAVRVTQKAMLRAIKTLKKEMDDILRVYMQRHELTREEAMAYLESPAAYDALDDIRAQIAKVTDPAIKRRLQARLESHAYGARLTRAEAMQESITANVGQVADVKLAAGREAIQTTLFDAQNRMMYDVQQNIGRMFIYAQMPVRRAQEVLSQRWLGGNYSSRVWLDANKLADDLQTCVMENMMAGKTSDQTYQEILDLCGQDMRKANRLIRTETSYAANQAEKYACEEAGLEQYLFISGLEARTCAGCGRLDDGTPRAYKDAEPGRNYPPMHPHCRCTTRPYNKDIEAILTDKDTRWARDPETGKEYAVPMKMTYEEWLKKQQEISGIDSVDVARKKLYNRTADKKQLEAYQTRLGKQNVPKTLDDFQKIKYNDVERWDGLKSSYRTIGEIDGKTWTEPFKEKARDMYWTLQRSNVEASAHGIGRILDRVNSDGTRITAQQVIRQMARLNNYLQEDGRKIRFYGDIAIVSDGTSDVIISVVHRQKAKNEWTEV